MTTWQFAFRNGFAPQLSTAALTALRTALAADDGRLLAGATTMPPPLQCVQDWPVEAWCPIGFAGWRGNGLVSVAEDEEVFARVCFEADQALGETAACRWFLNWWDTTPRAESLPALLAEVEAELSRRIPLAGPSAAPLRFLVPASSGGR